MPIPREVRERRAKMGSSLRSRGFDGSYFDKESGNYRIVCSQCQAMMINGLATHEHGCPNKPSAGLFGRRE